MKELNRVKPSLTSMLLISSACSVALIVLRVYISLSPMYIFLCWNLLLAWIPRIIATRLSKHTGNKFTVASILLLLLWLLFFPNAPYMVTDLIHLKQRAPVPLWFDLVLLISF